MCSCCSAGRSEAITQLQEQLRPDVVNAKLRDLVSGQAGTMLSFLATALTSVIGGGFAIFNVLSLVGGDAGGGVLPAARLAAGDRRWSIPGCRTAMPM